MSRFDSDLGDISSRMCSVGKTGVKLSKLRRLRAASGCRAFTASTRTRPEVPLAVLGRPDLPRHLVAGPQTEPPDLGLGDVYVAGPLLVAVLPQEAVAAVDDRQDPAGEGVCPSCRRRRGAPSSGAPAASAPHRSRRRRALRPVLSAPRWSCPVARSDSFHAPTHLLPQGS